MSTPAYKFTDRRRLYGGTSTNQAIEAATQNSQRRTVPMLDYDLVRNVSNFGRRTLMSMGRFLYENFPPIRGAINEIARLTVGTFLPQYTGANKEWGNLAEAWLKENDKWIDIRGRPFTMDTFNRNLVIALMRDGEMGVLLTKNAQGEPKIQVIPAHRISCISGLTTEVVKYETNRTDDSGNVFDMEGRLIGNMAWQGMLCIDGVIMDDFGAAVAYRVNDGNASISQYYRDISVNDMSLVFIPSYPEQVRGISPLATGAFHALSVNDSDQFEMFAQLINASDARQVYNESGTLDPTSEELTAAPTAPDSTTGGVTSLPSLKFQAGTITFFKAGSGQKVESMASQRPSTNVMAFRAELVREILHSIGWSVDFSLDPSKTGGAPMRVVVDRVKYTIRELQRIGVAPVRQRIDGWRVSNAINRGNLPHDADWYKWIFQGPPTVTADAKYTSDINLQENRAAIKPLREIAAENGDYWEDVQDQIIEEESRWQEKCKLAGIDPNRRLLTPNGNPAGEEADKREKQDKEEAAP